MGRHGAELGDVRRPEASIDLRALQRRSLWTRPADATFRRSMAELEARSADERPNRMSHRRVPAGVSWVELAEGRLAEAAERACVRSAISMPATLVGGHCRAPAARPSGVAISRSARTCLRRLEESSEPNGHQTLPCSTLQAGLDAADGRRSEALAGYRQAMARWQSSWTDRSTGRFARSTRSCLLGADRARGPSHGRRRPRRPSCVLGARPFLERLEAAMGVAPGLDHGHVRRQAAPTVGEQAAPPSEPRGRHGLTACRRAGVRSDDGRPGAAPSGGIPRRRSSSCPSSRRRRWSPGSGS